MERKQPLTAYYEIFYLLGLIFLSAGIAMMVRSDLGISVVSSVPYVISLHFQQLSFGTWSYIFQGLLILILIMIVRKIKWAYLISFIVSVAFGYLADLFIFLNSGLPSDSILWRWLYFTLGLFLTSLGIALFIHSRLPPVPYDLFVNDLAIYKSISFRRGKLLFDFTCLLISLVFLFLFVQKLVGIGIGTVITAFLHGTLAGLWIKIFNRHLQMRSLFRKDKLSAR